MLECEGFFAISVSIHSESTYNFTHQIYGDPLYSKCNENTATEKRHVHNEYRKTNPSWKCDFLFFSKINVFLFVFKGDIFGARRWAHIVIGRIWARTGNPGPAGELGTGPTQRYYSDDRKFMCWYLLPEFREKAIFKALHGPTLGHGFADSEKQNNR